MGKEMHPTFNVKDDYIKNKRMGTILSSKRKQYYDSARVAQCMILRWTTYISPIWYWPRSSMTLTWWTYYYGFATRQTPL